MPRLQAKAARRAAILEAAGRLLARHRFADITLDDVAAEAAVAKGTLYLYFDSKETLYLQYVAEVLRPLLETLRVEIPAAARKSAFAAVQIAMDRMLECKRRNPVIQDVMQGTTRASQQAAHTSIKDELRQLLIEAIRAGVESGELRDLSPELSVDVILATMPRLFEKCGRQKSRAQPIQEHFLQLLAHGLLAPQTKRLSPTHHSQSLAVKQL